MLRTSDRGATWTVAASVGVKLTAVWASAPDVYVVGAQGTILHGTL